MSKSVDHLTEQEAEAKRKEAPIVDDLRRSKRLRRAVKKHADSVEIGSALKNADPPDQEPNVADPDSARNETEAMHSDSTGYGVHLDDASTESSEEEAEEDTKPAAINTAMLEDFRAYCSAHSYHFLRLTREEKTCIKLLESLKRKKAPLNAYPDLLEWHLKETKHLRPHESLRDTEQYFHRKTLMKRLMDRYNMKGLMPKLKQLTLPFSKASVTIPYRDAADCIVSLLTDPRVEATDYLFFDKDPLAPPPESVPYLQDLNTGKAFLKSYEKYITKPNQVLLPILFYIDGAVTGQFSDLPVTALKMALGIHSRDARDQEWAWRELAWIPQVRKEQARGKKLFLESNHMESQDVVVLDGEGGYAETDDEDTDSNEEEEHDSDVKAQDFHSMLRFALQSFVKLQKSGFKWDLPIGNKLYKNLEFVLFVVNVKCDTEEGDLLCGKYTVRTSNVKHICRYCHCPTEQADNPLARFPMKKQHEIQRLVEKRKLDQLKAISQQDIQNAFYSVRFHAANDRGIHGACPSEMLHAILLGVFKYVRSIFFVHMGDTSKLSEDINGLAKMYGKLLTHQSDRDIPYTNFGKGIQKGKLMAKQFRGVLLVMAAVLRSTLGRELLKKRKKFGGDTGLRDWTLLVELLLEWEAFLCQKRMKKAHVKRLAKKHRFIMYIMKNVASRSKGMGLKIMKFHAILHLMEDILLYGVPMEFDTGFNESHHKTTKVAAKLTQRKESTFNHQTAKRMTEFHLLDLAMYEVREGKCVWEYFAECDDTEKGPSSPNQEDDSSMDEALHPDLDQANPNLGPMSPDPDSNIPDAEAESDTNQEPIAVDPEDEPLKVRTGGTRIKIFEDEEDDNRPSFTMGGRSKHKNSTVWMQDVIDFLNGLQNLLYVPSKTRCLPVYTEHQRGEHIFRGHPNHRGEGPWKDWAIIDWGTGYGKLPSHIWCFVSLENVSGSITYEYGGIILKNGVYAVVEVATYDDEQGDLKSDLFTPLTLEVESTDVESEFDRKFYLAPVEAISKPCIVIPDIGGPPNAYFQLKPRSDWTKEFIYWLNDVHTHDDIEADV